MRLHINILWRRLSEHISICSELMQIQFSNASIISGKSLLCKEGAIRMTKRLGHSRNVYYISLLAVDRFGRHHDQFFTFDEASKLDLKDTSVIVLDVHQLFIRYRQRHPMMRIKALKDVNIIQIAPFTPPKGPLNVKV